MHSLYRSAISPDLTAGSLKPNVSVIRHTQLALTVQSTWCFSWSKYLLITYLRDKDKEEPKCGSDRPAVVIGMSLASLQTH